MEGQRRKIDLPVSAIVDEVIGMSSYMEIDTLNRLTGEGAVVSAAALFVEPSALPALSRRFKELPVIEFGGDEGLHADARSSTRSPASFSSAPASSRPLR